MRLNEYTTWSLSSIESPLIRWTLFRSHDRSPVAVIRKPYFDEHSSEATSWLPRPRCARSAGRHSRSCCLRPAINQDGSTRDSHLGEPSLTNKQKEFLRNDGWNVN